MTFGIGDDHTCDQTVRGERFPHRLASLGEEFPRQFAAAPVPQPANRTQHGAGKLTCCVRGAFRGHAQAAAGVWFSRATATRALNASASVTARSARILRSTCTPAFFRPLMKRL